MKKILGSSIAAFAMFASAQAAIVEFDFLGKAGAGLLGGNENGVLNGVPGSGGELNLGSPGSILYDDVTNIITFNVGWGSQMGFTDLTGPVIAGHLHGPTVNGGVASFTQNASVKYPLDSLPGWNTSATNGGFNGSTTILQTDEAALLNGQFYFNVHTSANGGGEIRGNLVVVPEPASFGLVVCGALALFGARRRCRA